MPVRILIVDDNADDRRHLVVELQRASFEAQPAASVDDALELLARQSFDLVLTDIYMPDRDGLELLMAVKKLRPALPVVGMTGEKREWGLAEVFRSLGGAAMIRKPVALAELVPILTTLLRKA